jgi:NAD(P)-dependent dehydrogenase (short-subunit alcohol dehydrogenase family)
MIYADRFAGKTLVVTGAAQGIGRAVALRAAAEGGNVLFVDRADFVRDVASEAGNPGAQLRMRPRDLRGCRKRPGRSGPLLRRLRGNFNSPEILACHEAGIT